MSIRLCAAGSSVVALVALLALPPAAAQVPSIGSVKCSVNGRPVPCEDGPSGGGGGAGGNNVLNRGLDAAIDGVIGLFGGTTQAEYERKKRSYDLNEEGRALARAGHRRAALEKYRQALALDPSSRVVRLNIANNESVLAAEAGDLPLAIAKAREALQYSDDPAYRRWLEGLEQQLREDKTSQQAEAYNARGSTALRQGNLAAAEAAYREAIRLGPNVKAYHYNLGLTLERLRRFAEAEAAFQRATALKPGDPTGHYKLGLMRINLRRYADAEQAYRAALRLIPGDANTRVSLGYALERQARSAEAVAEYREAIRLEPNNAWGHLRLGEVLRDGKNWAAAEGSYREAVRLDPNSADARFGLAYTLMEQGKRVEAEKEYRETLRVNPDSRGARFNLAGSLLSRKPREAEALVRRVTELDPRWASAHNRLGRALEIQGRYREAEAAYRQALALEPSHQGATDNLKQMRQSVQSRSDAIWSNLFPLEAPPSGNRAVSPGTAASAAPPGGSSGGGTALDQARAAAEQGAAARTAGRSLGEVPGDEPKRDRAGLVFDTPGPRPSAGAGGAVDASGLATRRTIPPELVAKNPALRRLQRRQAANEAEHKRLRDRLDEVRREKATPGADRGALEMREVDLKDRLSKNEYEAGLIRRDIDRTVETVQKPDEPKTASFLVPFDEAPATTTPAATPAPAPRTRP